MMTLNQAFSARVKEILKEKKMTQYRLEQITGLYHSTINTIMNGKIKASNFKTMAIIISALGVSIQEFFNTPLFNFANLEID